MSLLTVLMRKAGKLTRSRRQEGAEGCPALACGSTRLQLAWCLGMEPTESLPLENQSSSPSSSRASYRWAPGLSPSSFVLFLCEQSFNLFLAAYHFINQSFLPGPGSSPEALPLGRDVHSSANDGFYDGKQ